MFYDDLARQRHSAHRRALVRSEKERKTKELEKGRLDLDRAALRIKEQETFRRNNMVGKGLVQRLDAVGKSMGVNVHTVIRPGREVSASTIIGKSIEVVHDRRLLGKYDDETDSVLISEATLQEIAIETRGFYYHEVGHNLFTIPLQDLVLLAVDEGFIPDERLVSVNEAYKPGGRYGESDPFILGALFRQSWNILEDQRMEAALIRYSPVLKNYLAVMVIRNIANRSTSVSSNWVLLAGRDYLPEEVRSMSRELWDTVGKATLGTTFGSDDILNLVNEYRSASSALAMVGCIMRLVNMLNGKSVGAGNNHGGMASSQIASGYNMDARKNAAKDQLSSSASNGEEVVDDEDGDSFADGLSGSTDTSSGSSDHSDKPAPTNSEFREMMSEALGKSLDALRDEQTVAEDVSSMNNAYATDDAQLPEYHRITESTDGMIMSRAQILADDIEQSFRVATQQAAPRWEVQQRRGILDPMRYIARQPGDMEFFKDYVDRGDPGADIAVSVFLDISGSMSGSETELGAAAWAMKTACDRINVQCEVILFDDDAYTLWTNNARPLYVPHIEVCGGTNPEPAFRAILSEERDKQQHLVLVMTDGDWAYSASMAPYRNRNSYGVLFFYDSTNPASEDYALASRLGADEGYRIDDLNQMPIALESLLLSMV
jgi:hypothetical protein